MHKPESRWAIAKPASERAHPIVRRLMNEAIERRILDEALASKAGFSVNTMRKWRHGINQPSIGNVEILANALGYDLVLVKR